MKDSDKWLIGGWLISTFIGFSLIPTIHLFATLAQIFVYIIAFLKAFDLWKKEKKVQQ